MRLFLKTLLGLVGTLVLLLVLAAIALPLMFDTEDLKHTLEGEVARRTGRDLVIAGDLSFSVFPWLAVEVSELSLTNPPGFGTGPFAEVGKARAGVALLPLLRKQIFVDEIRLAGLRLDLVVNEAGTGNWEDLLAGGEEPSAAGADPFAGRQIAGLDIADAEIGYRDQRTGQAYRVRNFALKTGALGRPGPVPLELSMALEDLTAETAMELELRAVATPDYAGGVHTLDGLTLGFRQGGGAAVDLRAEQALVDLGREVYIFRTLEATIDQDGQRIGLAAPDARASLADQTLEMAEFTARAAGLDISGSLDVRQILDAPAFAGSARVGKFSPAALMRELGMEPPVTADPGVLKNARLNADFEGDLDGIAMHRLDMTLDDSELSGQLRVRDLDRPRIRFELDVDRIDLDRYLAPAAAGSTDEGDATEIPGQALEGLDVQGTLRVAELRAMGLDLTDAEVGLTIADNRLQLNPLNARFYGGTFSGDMSLDASGPVPVVSLNEQIQAVVFRQLARDLLGQDNVSGQAFGKLQLTGRGNTTGEVLRNLAGDVGLRLDEGALEGVNVWHEIRRAVAAFKGQAVPAPAENRTVFSRMSLNASVRDGVMNLDELLGQLPFLDLSGGGSIDLASQALNLDLLAAVRRAPELSQDPLTSALQGKRLPFTLKGSLTKPDIGIDVAQLLKGEATDRLVEKLGEKLGIEPTEGQDASVEDVAAGLLGGLLGGDRKKTDAAPEQSAPEVQKETPEAEAEPSDGAEAGLTAEERKALRQEERRRQRQEARDAEKEGEEAAEDGADGG